MKGPLLAIEKQWTGWDGRFPKHMLLYTNPEKQHKGHNQINRIKVHICEKKKVYMTTSGEWKDKYHTLYRWVLTKKNTVTVLFERPLSQSFSENQWKPKTMSLKYTAFQLNKITNNYKYRWMNTSQSDSLEKLDITVQVNCRHFLTSLSKEKNCKWMNKWKPYL